MTLIKSINFYSFIFIYKYLFYILTQTYFIYLHTYFNLFIDSNQLLTLLLK